MERAMDHPAVFTAVTDAERALVVHHEVRLDGEDELLQGLRGEGLLSWWPSVFASACERPRFCSPKNLQPVMC
eukprot:14037304-Heterocapsa_arctica.AAC.1